MEVLLTVVQMLKLFAQVKVILQIPCLQILSLCQSKGLITEFSLEDPSSMCIYSGIFKLTDSPLIANFPRKGLLVAHNLQIVFGILLR